MNNNVLVSFIIPAFNVAKYIGDCVKSINALNIESFEILIINDGSSDDTLDVINLLAQQYNNVKVFNQKNKGVSVARNEGLKMACGKYVLFVDGDDVLNSGLANALEIAENSNCDFVKGWYRILDLNKNVFIKHDAKNVSLYSFETKNISTQKLFSLELKKKEIEVTSSMYLFKREYLIKHGIIFPEGIGYEEDHIFTLRTRLSDSNSKCRTIYEPFFTYRYRSNSATKNPKYKQLEDIVFVLNEEERIISAFKFKKRLFYRYLSASFTQFVTIYNKIVDEKKEVLLRNISKSVKKKILLHPYSLRCFLKAFLLFYFPSLLKRIYERKDIKQ